jgi:hypothetical protein
MVFGIWNIRSLYSAGSLKTFAKEIAKYKLHVEGVQEAKWDRGGTEQAGKYIFFHENGNDSHELGRGLFVHTRTISAIKRSRPVSGGMSYIPRRGH